MREPRGKESLIQMHLQKASKRKWRLDWALKNEEGLYWLTVRHFQDGSSCGRGSREGRLVTNRGSSSALLNSLIYQILTEHLTL